MKTALRLLTLVLMITSVATFAQRTVKTKDFSGWMEDYDTLTYIESKNGYLFTNESLRGHYESILLEPVEIFSQDGEPNEEHAQRAREYLTDGLQDILEERNIAASAPGPKVVRLKLAITGVEKSKEELKAYNFIPVSAVFRGAQAATGNVPTYMATMFEGQASDSVSGERVMAIVTKGIEETEKRSGDNITFEDFQPTLDKWLAQYAETIDNFLAQKSGQ